MDLSETTTVEDGIAVMNWIADVFKDSTSKPHIIAWGHSLGSSIVSRTLIDVDDEVRSLISGLILESPFNKMEDELNHFNTVTWTAWLLGVVYIDTKYKRNFEVLF